MGAAESTQELNNQGVKLEKSSTQTMPPPTSKAPPSKEKQNPVKDVAMSDDDVIYVGRMETVTIDLTTPENNLRKNFARRQSSQLIRLDASCRRSIYAEKEQNSKDNSIEITSPVNKPNNKQMKCPICLQNIKDATSTICGHIFCDACIKMALKAKSKCPVCNRITKDTTTHRIYL